MEGHLKKKKNLKIILRCHLINCKACPTYPRSLHSVNTAWKRRLNARRMLLQCRPRPFQVLNFASVETWSREIGIRLEIKPRLRERLCEIVGRLRCSIFLRLTQGKKKRKRKEGERFGCSSSDRSVWLRSSRASSVASVVLLLLLFSFLGVRD